MSLTFLHTCSFRHTRQRGSGWNVSIRGTDSIEAAVSSGTLSAACGRVIIVVLTEVGLVPFTYYRRAAEPDTWSDRAAFGRHLAALPGWQATTATTLGMRLLRTSF